MAPSVYHVNMIFTAAFFRARRNFGRKNIGNGKVITVKKLTLRSYPVKKILKSYYKELD